MVALAAGSSSRSTEISYQTKITAVMLREFAGYLLSSDKRSVLPQTCFITTLSNAYDQ
jgi:hypothetical protein